MSSQTQTAKQLAFLNDSLMAVTVLLNRLVLIQTNGAETAAGCATATTTSQAKTTNTFAYQIDGVWKSKGATDNFWTLTGATVPVSSFTKYLLLINAAGAASVLQSSVALTAAGCIFPSCPDALAIAGILQVATDGTHTFLPATTLLGAAGITATFTDGAGNTLLPLIADSNTGAQILSLSGGANSGSLLG